ncbi:ATP-binding cassette domain-containing protein [Acetobacteraceae bacterium H6797]|nr:ATP-binding cassette domain-containing protein [Acetobacteraceae bacterium H6797]
MNATTYRPLLIAAIALLILPFAASFIGLTTRTSVDVVIYAIAVMGLNVLVGTTGLVSFGHGAWFGIGAYAVGIIQRHYFPGDMVLPAIAALIIVLVLSTLAGLLILRRRGVYFSLLTLAFTAMLFTIAFRWTDLTGGENGFSGITRYPALQDDMAYYTLAAVVGFGVIFALWRFHRAPAGTVLVAIRENEQRAQFIGYDTRRYKLLAFVLAASVTGLAGVLSAFNHRFASADPISIAFSGELLVMVVIGGMRSFLGPALGALFYILFREFLSIYTPNWLLIFGLLFVAFIVFSPLGLVGVAQQIMRPFRKEKREDASMANRQIEAPTPLPANFNGATTASGIALKVEDIGKSFGNIHAVRTVSFDVHAKSLHALIGPNGAGKTTAFNLISGMFPPDKGKVTLDGNDITGLEPQKITQAGLGRSFQITNLFPTLSIEENARLAVQARHPSRFGVWKSAASLTEVQQETTQLLRWMGLAGIEKAEAGALSYGGQRLLDMALALATKPRVLLLDEPLAGLAAAERGRVGDLIKRISSDLPVLLVEHDIDRVFQLADQVTVMADGEVLVDGSVEQARTDARVQEVYLGSGTAAIAAKERQSAATDRPLLEMQGVNTLYGKSHILQGVDLKLNEGEILALLGRNGAGKSTMLKTIMGLAKPAEGSVVTLGGESIAGLGADVIARKGVAFVPQGRGLFAGMTVAENLSLGRLKRITGAGQHWEEERLLELFPRLKQRWTTAADRLSGGEQQMVAVARALTGDTRLLLLDEPFEGLSPAVTEELFEAFDKLRQSLSVIIVDHNLDLALALSDSVVALERGAVTWSGAAKVLRDDADLRRKVLWL